MEYIIKAIICFLFGSLSLYFKVLDKKGTIAAVIIGAIIIFSTKIEWFFLLLLFLILGFIVTKFKFGYKEKKRLHESGNGVRRVSNVIANGLPPAVAAFLVVAFPIQKMAIPFTVSIAVATSDTFASEIGVLSNNAYMITNLKKVDPGVNGAISWLGQGCALLGSAIIGIASFFLLELQLEWVAVIIFLGFIGCQIDSLLGATLQGGERSREYQLPSDAILTNSDVNLISISFTALIAFVIAVLLF
ncbi:MAG: DUF92 domain-containing protein [Thermoplasmata archaeon]|nr:MAG: DUF92 domain-containing protein [Thermoplasmata archaeon]